MHAKRRPRTEQGETLLELVVAIGILGVIIVAIAAGVALSVKVTDIHRKQATANAFVRSYAEAIDNTVANSSWAGCAATTATYATPAGFTMGPLVGSYTASVTSIEYWNGTAFAGNCSAGDKGLQRLTVMVASSDSGQRASEKLTLVIRDPCVSSC